LRQCHLLRLDLLVNLHEELFLLLFSLLQEGLHVLLPLLFQYTSSLALLVFQALQVALLLLLD